MKTLIKIFILFLAMSNTEMAIASIPAPTGNATQYFCDAESLTLADAAIFNTAGYTEIYWYDNADQTGSAIDPNTVVVDGAVYYAFQAVDPTAESLEITFNLESDIPMSTGDSTQYTCDGGSRTLSDLSVFNTGSFTEIFWFSDTNQTTPLPSNTVLDGTTYYAFQGIGSCAVALEVTVELVPPIPAPTGDSNQYFNEGSGFTLADAAVYNTGTFDSIYWFSSSTQEGGSEVDPFTDINDGDVYYAFQGIGCGCGCVLHLEVTFHMIPIGIADYQKTAISIYPNPVVDYMNIKTNQTIDSVKLYNLQAQVVDFTYTISDGELQLDLSNCQSGIYFVKIKTDKLTSTYKVIK